MRVSPNSPFPTSYSGHKPLTENPKILSAAGNAQKIMAPYFMPFMVKIFRETHPYDFFPRRWFESPSLMGVFKGFSNFQAREQGIKKVTEEQLVYYQTLALAFQWPVQAIAQYMTDSGLGETQAFKQGMVLARNVLQEQGQRKKIHELSLIRMIDDEHYRIADDLKKILTNETLKMTFQPKDFQIAKGW